MKQDLLLRMVMVVVLIICCSVDDQEIDEDKIIINRIGYFYRLKSLADQSVWKGFDDPAFELPLVYYTNKHCYVVNPTQKLLTVFNPPLIHKKGRIEIYKTGLLDSTAFHMETFMNFTDTAAYNYRSMYMNCSSFEITQQHPQADVKNLERWATLVLHEYFHGFQFKHPAFSTYHNDSILPVSGETLRKVYDDNPWVKESIDRENDLLLQVIASDKLNEITPLIDSFFVLRSKRRDIIRRSSGFDIGKYETFFETMEGTARYIEYGLFNIFKHKKPDKQLARVDTAYHAYQYFRTFTLQDDPSMYLTSKTNYVYAIGFNLARIADKLQIPYKSRLFNEPGLSLEALLHAYVNK